MNLMRASFIGLLVLGAAHAASAQQASVDVKRLPVDLNKLTRDLRQTAATESHNGLHIRYTVDVYGQAPRIEFFTKQDNLKDGPVPYGAPSHREMIDHVTPVEYRPPVMDFSALLRWLSDKTNKK
jgi:hypothetical protein